MFVRFQQILFFLIVFLKKKTHIESIIKKTEFTNKLFMPP